MLTNAWQAYRERATGDYLVARKRPTTRNSQIHEALACDEDTKMSTLEWTIVTADYLQDECEPVDAALIPPEWADAITENWEAA